MKQKLIYGASLALVATSNAVAGPLEDAADTFEALATPVTAALAAAAAILALFVAYKFLKKVFGA